MIDAPGNLVVAALHPFENGLDGVCCWGVLKLVECKTGARLAGILTACKSSLTPTSLINTPLPSALQYAECNRTPRYGTKEGVLSFCQHHKRKGMYIVRNGVLLVATRDGSGEPLLRVS